MGLTGCTSLADVREATVVPAPVVTAPDASCGR